MKLSVLTITYNQEKYVAQTIESALMQQTDFDFEIVIGDDCSTDGTQEIIRRYEAAHPEKIRALYHSERLGMQENLQRVYRACRGDYVAVLEGDDYWTSPTKLQRQVDFLDHHPECALCFHPARLIDETTGRDYDYGPSELKESYGIEDILQENFVPACSIVYRNGVVPEIPQWVSELKVADWPMLVLHAKRGRLGYIDESMVIYRRHAEGLWSGASREERLRTVVSMYQYLNQHLEGKYEPFIRVLVRRWMEFSHWEEHREQLEKRLHELAAERGKLWERIRELAEERATLHTTLWERIRQLSEERAAEHTALWARIHELEIALVYRALVWRVRKAVWTGTPAGTTVIVVSRGDEAMLELDGRRAWHFPQTEEGVYAGCYPADGAEAIAQLERLRAKGGDFLLVPSTAAWWLKHYSEFREHLERHAPLVVQDDACTIYALRAAAGSQQPQSAAPSLGAAQRACPVGIMRRS